jgi:hypothetical protein
MDVQRAKETTTATAAAATINRTAAAHLPLDKVRSLCSNSTTEGARKRGRTIDLLCAALLLCACPVVAPRSWRVPVDASACSHKATVHLCPFPCPLPPAVCLLPPSGLWQALWLFLIESLHDFGTFNKFEAQF